MDYNESQNEKDAPLFFDSILDSLREAVIVINLQGIVLRWNKSAERILGLTTNQAIGLSIDSVEFPVEFRQCLSGIDRIRSGEQIECYDTLHLRNSEGDVFAEISCCPVKNNMDEVIGISIRIQDITALRRTEEALRQSESRLRGVFETAVDFGIMVFDAEGKFVDWNKGAERLFGYTREEILGKHSSTIFTEEDRRAGMAEAEMQTARRTGRSIDERWHLHKDGTRFFMSGVMTLLQVDGLQGFVKIARNITERKLVEEALFMSEQRKSLAIKSAEMGEWEWDLGSNNIRISDQVAILMGMSPDILVVSPSFMLGLVLAEDQQSVSDAIATAFAGLHILQLECRIRRVDNNEIKWVNIYGRVVRHQTQIASRMIGVVYDITPRKVMEQQKDDFIGLASHELKTPVTAIKTYSEYLLEHFEESNATHEISIVRKMSNQVDRMTTLMKNLLDTSVLSEGRIKLFAQPLDLNALVEMNLDSIREAAPQHTINWKPGRIATVHADQERILQVITNFVGNAGKYSQPNTDITISTSDDQDKAIMRVQDSGMGIPTEAQNLIFDRYYRATNAPDQKGFGLGLYICAEIIRQHGGSIGVASTPQEGSTFYFSLPYS